MSRTAMKPRRERGISITVTFEGASSPATHRALIELGNALLHSASSPLFAAAPEKPACAGLDVSSQPTPAAEAMPLPADFPEWREPPHRSCGTCRDMVPNQPIPETDLVGVFCRGTGQLIEKPVRETVCDHWRKK